MKKNVLWIGLLIAGVISVQAQTCLTGDCDCASCAAKKRGTAASPFLEELQNAQEPQPKEHSDEGREGHDHDDPEGHTHGAETGVAQPEKDVCCPHDEPVSDPHTGHDHGAHSGGVELSEEMIRKVGITLQQAQGGTISLSSVFPAEIKLNRDRMAAVSPRYPSIVRQVFSEIGDEVKKGDVLAALENRETMAVYTVSAPLDGIVISKNLSVGEAASEERVLYEVADLSSVWADISIFPRYQHLIRKNMKVKLIAHDGHTAEGTIRYISPVVSHETRTFTARCVLEGADEDFTPGAFVRARVDAGGVNAEVLVPRDAVQTVDGESVVFIPGDHGFITVPVHTGLADERMIEVKSGLNAGDRFVAAGAFALKAQMITGGMDPHAGHGH